ncbi:MAG: MBL fold metallo-hydrolase [Candidatus Thermoplasmatota archaeon]|nr:MBL fold metallo-hydrolase [Candidatus Thermoplasmatota archaeon]
MNIQYIYGKQYDSNIFIIIGKKTTVIDTGTGLYHEEIIKKLKDIIDPTDISQIILTHEHYDHTGGVKKLFDSTEGKAEIIAHAFASSKIEKGESFFAKLLGGEMPKMHVDLKLNGTEILQIGDEMVQVFSTPGHTPGCICLYNKEQKTLFSGDTVFANGSFGRYDLPGGNLTELKQSIRFLHTLDIESLYPGHESVVEKDANKHIALSLQQIESLRF